MPRQALEIHFGRVLETTAAEWRCDPASWASS
jgi:hypothetical protein